MENVSPSRREAFFRCARAGAFDDWVEEAFESGRSVDDFLVNDAFPEMLRGAFPRRLRCNPSLWPPSVCVAFFEHFLASPRCPLLRFKIAISGLEPKFVRTLVRALSDGPRIFRRISVVGTCRSPDEFFAAFAAMPFLETLRYDCVRADRMDPLVELVALPGSNLHAFRTRSEIGTLDSPVFFPGFFERFERTKFARLRVGNNGFRRLAANRWILETSQLQIVHLLKGDSSIASFEHVSKVSLTGELGSFLGSHWSNLRELTVFWQDETASVSGDALSTVLDAVQTELPRLRKFTAHVRSETECERVLSTFETRPAGCNPLAVQIWTLSSEYDLSRASTAPRKTDPSVRFELLHTHFGNYTQTSLDPLIRLVSGSAPSIFASIALNESDFPDDPTWYASLELANAEGLGRALANNKWLRSFRLDVNESLTQAVLRHASSNTRLQSLELVGDQNLDVDWETCFSGLCALSFDRETMFFSSLLPSFRRHPSLVRVKELRGARTWYSSARLNSNSKWGPYSKRLFSATLQNLCRDAAPFNDVLPFKP